MTKNVNLQKLLEELCAKGDFVSIQCRCPFSFSGSDLAKFGFKAAVGFDSRRGWVKSLASTHSLAAKPVPTLLLAACYTIASLLPLGKALCPSSAKKVRNSPCTGSLLLTFLL